MPPIELDVTQWFNTPEPLTLAGLRGRVVVLHAFQMLCPGCVLTGTPFAQRLHDTFAGPDVVVIGVHTVFEHHGAMTPVSLAAYLHEFRITMPVAVDRPASDGPIPLTMQALDLQGTPSLVVFDRAGVIRASLFGAVNELALASLITSLAAEPVEPADPVDPAEPA
jgi:thiol-disulfide isomerase/thioredoxin